MKRTRNKERLDILSDAHYNQEKEFENAQALNNHQIQNILMSAYSILYSIQFCQLVKKVKRNLKYQNQTFIENTFNIKANSIAYPNGDYCNRDIQLVNAGYEAGLARDYGFNIIQLIYIE